MATDKPVPDSPCSWKFRLSCACKAPSRKYRHRPQLAYGVGTGGALVAYIPLGQPHVVCFRTRPWQPEKRVSAMVDFMHARVRAHMRLHVRAYVCIK